MTRHCIIVTSIINPHVRKKYTFQQELQAEDQVPNDTYLNKHAVHLYQVPGKLNRKISSKPSRPHQAVT